MQWKQVSRNKPARLRLGLLGITGTLALALSASAMALPNYFNMSDPGFLVGAQLGLARANYGSTLSDGITALPNSSSKKGGVAGHVFVGGQFNRYLSAELGYFFLPPNKYSFSALSTNGSLKEKTRAMDLVAKFALPLHAFDLYAKVGGAYVWSKISGNTSGLVNFSESANRSGLRPTYGVGLDYNITDKVAIDASWQQIYGRKSSR